MTQALIQLLSSALSIWDSKEKTKYQDQLIDLKTRYYEELKKPENRVDDAVLDDIRIRLCILVDSFTAQIGGPAVPNKP